MATIPRPKRGPDARKIKRAIRRVTDPQMRDDGLVFIVPERVVSVPEGWVRFVRKMFKRAARARQEG